MTVRFCRWARACASRVKGPALAVAGMSRSGMSRDRDVAAFGERAQGYDEGWRGELHHQIADRTADLALTCVPAPRRILDVGCGTGYLLGRLRSEEHTCDSSHPSISYAVFCLKKKKQE